MHMYAYSVMNVPLLSVSLYFESEYADEGAELENLKLCQLEVKHLILFLGLALALPPLRGSIPPTALPTAAIMAGVDNYLINCITTATCLRFVIAAHGIYIYVFACTLIHVACTADTIPMSTISRGCLLILPTSSIIKIIIHI